MSVAPDRSSDLVSLSGLRSSIIERLGMILAGAASILAWLALVRDPFQPWLLVSLLALLALGLAAYRYADRYPTLLRYLLTACLTAALLLAFWYLPHPWLPALSLLLVMVSAMLVPGSEFVTGGLVALASVVLGRAELWGYSTQRTVRRQRQPRTAHASQPHPRLQRDDVHFDSRIPTPGSFFCTTGCRPSRRSGPVWRHARMLPLHPTLILTTSGQEHV